MFHEPMVFKVNPPSGKLDPRLSIQIEIAFVARATTLYHVYLPLYVTLDETDSIIRSIQLTGIGTSVFSKPPISEIRFPVISLEIKLQYELFIFNSAFIQTN